MELEDAVVTTIVEQSVVAEGGKVVVAILCGFWICEGRPTQPMDFGSHITPWECWLAKTKTIRT